MWNANQLHDFFIIDSDAKWRVNYVAYVHKCKCTYCLWAEATTQRSSGKKELLKLANPQTIRMKKYRYIGIYRNFDCKFHVANFRKAIFKNTFFRTPAVAFSKMINLTREVFISFFIHFSSELDMQKILEIDLTFKLCSLVSK